MRFFHWHYWGKHILGDQLFRSSAVDILKWNFPWWANPHESLTLLKSLEVSLGLLLAPDYIRGRHGCNSFERYKAQLCGSSHHTSHSNIHEKTDFDVCIATLADSLKSHQAPGTIPWARRGACLPYFPPRSFSGLSPVLQPSLPTYLIL